MDLQSVKFDGHPHIIDARQFTRPWLEEIFFPLSAKMKAVFENGGCQDLAEKRMAVTFYEPSTRTRYYSQMAMEYMGGRVVFVTENAREFSSAKKGEIIRDSIRVLDRARPDVIVIRYDQEGGAKIAAEVSRAAIINAGDGPGQHPTQALLDIYTIQQRIGHIDDLSIAMVGDLVNGRTVRSLCYLLGKFENVKIYFVSPKSAQMKEDIKDYLRRNDVEFYETTDLREIIRFVDVAYQTRVQKERGTLVDITNGCYCRINSQIVEMAKPDSIIMHPLPRVDELSLSVDSDPRAVYLTDQLDSSLSTKMALLKIILAPNLSI